MQAGGGSLYGQLKAPVPGLSNLRESLQASLVASLQPSELRWGGLQLDTGGSELQQLLAASRQLDRAPPGTVGVQQHGLLGALGGQIFAEAAAPDMQPMGAVPGVGRATAVEEYMNALQAGGEMSRGAVQPETQRRYGRDWGEFEQWFSGLSQAIGGQQTAMQAAPEDVVAYCEVWRQRHGETQLPSGAGSSRLISYPAPSTLEAMLGHLAAVFDLGGRVGGYDTHGSGNPVRSLQIKRYKQGYGNHVNGLGYAPMSAVHLAEDKYVRLAQLELNKLLEMREEVKVWGCNQETVAYVCRLRDLTGVVGAYESALRGGNMGKLRGTDVQQHSSGEPLVGRLVDAADFPFEEGFQYQVAPNGTKPKPRRRAGVVVLEVLPSGSQRPCFLRVLHILVRTLAGVGFGLEPYLLRPSTPNQRGLQAEALSSSSLNKSLQARLREHELFAGETLHGVRRGTLQAQRAAGASVAEVGERALHAPPYTTTRLYLDTSRETGGPVRLHNKKRRVVGPEE